ncbi:MAG: glycosyltransferase family 4 protein [Alphaproteobacteria bacterium]|nr:glycosyltransferase family 4 protein [Alphaproteobacteria bacterium]
MTDAGPVRLVVPGPLETRTGGFIYDRHIAHGLEGLGRLDDVVCLQGAYPEPAAGELARDLALLGERRGMTVIDGLCFTALAAARDYRPWPGQTVALVHHPLADETGPGEQARARLLETERRALATACGCIVTSAATGRRLAEFGCGPGRVRVVPPGLERPAPGPVRSPGGGPLRLLCVATLVPRKGHDVLLAALAELSDLDWTLDLVGPARDRDWARHVERLVADHSCSGRIRLNHEVPDPAGFYRRADLFVLASRHEGFGMALAEALAAGLPVVSCRTGAIPGTVPEDAGILVPPDDPPALAGALRRVIADPALRSGMAAAAHRAGERFADWETTARRFAAAVDALAGGG